MLSLLVFSWPLVRTLGVGMRDPPLCGTLRVRYFVMSAIRKSAGWSAITVAGMLAAYMLIKPAGVERKPIVATNDISRSEAASRPNRSHDPWIDQAVIASAPTFIDWTARAGVLFRYYDNSDAERFFNAETNGGGVAWLDYDLDGRLDLFFTNGCRLPYDPADRSYSPRLFRNVHEEAFPDVTLAAGARCSGFFHSVTVGDLDNDGWADLFLGGFERTALLLNNGDGTFQDAAELARAALAKWCSSAAMGDLDRDGDLDLYVTAYAKGDLDNIPECRGAGYRAYCGPDRYEPEAHTFLVNLGNRVFEDVTQQAGFLKVLGRGMGAVIADLDDDGWPDVFVANDKTPSYLFHNVTAHSRARAVRVEEVGVESGLATNGQGQLVAGMGIACGDADGDGRLDLVVTHYQGEMTTFYRNTGGLFFSDETAVVGLGTATLPFLGFGVDFLDANNDGELDIVIANGHVLGRHHHSYAMPPQFFFNRGGHFEEATDRAGPTFRKEFVGRGLAVGDFDNDGGADFAVVNNDQPAYIQRNAAKSRGKWLRFDLVGTRSNRSAMNARVVVRIGDRRLVRELHGGGSYQSASDQRILVGLGDSTKADDVEIRWPSGQLQRVGSLEGNRGWLVAEGRTPQ